jgi:arylsulfatase
VFFTTDPKVTLPRGTRLEFEVQADDQWQEVSLELPTDRSIQQLRIDVSEGPGNATIADLKLLNTEGTPMISWPTANP